MHVKVRRQGSVRSTAVLLAVGINGEDKRKILGLLLALSETEEAWKSFLEQLSERGLMGVEHVTDAEVHTVALMQVYFRTDTLKRAYEFVSQNAPEAFPKRPATSNGSAV